MGARWAAQHADELVGHRDLTLAARALGRSEAAVVQERPSDANRSRVEVDILVGEHRLAASEWVETDALFPTRRGTYPLIRNVQRRFRRLVDRLGLPEGTSPHTLRHTWASTLLTSGVPIFLVSRYAGHATIQTTVDQYGHLLPGDAESAQLIRDTLDARFRGSG